MTTKDNAGQGQPDADAGSVNDDSSPPGDGHDDDQGDDDQDDGKGDGKASGEAKRYRLKLRAAEKERDELAELLGRTRQAIVTGATEAAGLTQRHIAAAEISVENLLTDDGLIDADKLADAVNAAVAEFGIRRPPAPNPQQGRPGGPAHDKASWSQALKGH